MLDLKAAYGRRYRITLDESAEIDGQTIEDRQWLYQIPGRYGHVFVQGVVTLGAYVRTHRDSSDRLGRLLAIPGARLLQRGDDEASVAFDPEHLDAVAEILRLKRRRHLSEEHRSKLAESNLSYRFAPGSKRLGAGAGSTAGDRDDSDVEDGVTVGA